MKKIASLLFALSFIGLISCGPSKEEVEEKNNEAQERAKELNDAVMQQEALMGEDFFADDDSTMDADTNKLDTIQ